MAKTHHLQLSRYEPIGEPFDPHPGWKGIVKVQQSTDGAGDVLIYDATRSIMFEGPGDHLLLGHMGKRLKRYYMGTLDEELKIEIDLQTKVPQDQPW